MYSPGDNLADISYYLRDEIQLKQVPNQKKEPN